MNPTKQSKLAAVFLIAALTLSMSLDAQPWFGHSRHNRNNSTFGNGKRVFSLSLGADPWGYVRSGYWPNSIPATAPNFEYSYYDGAGGYGPGSIYAEYSIFDDPFNCSAPFKQADCNGVMFVGAANTGGAEVFAVAGVYRQGLFFSTINVAGFPVSNVRLRWPYQTTKMPRKPFIYTSPVKFGTFYITGDFDHQMYVIKVDATTTPATVKWARFYFSGDSLTSRAIIQSPYDTSDVMVVGARYGRLASGVPGHEAFLMSLDNPTGNVNFLNTYCDPRGRDAWFTSIKKADCVTGGADGYLIGGYCISRTLNNVTYPQWMTKLDRFGNTVWSSLIQPIYSTPLNQQTTWEINDVCERKNPTTGKYENYGIAGSTLNKGTTFALDYLTVFKLDDAGQRGVLTPTEFRYFTTGGHGHFASCYLEYAESGIIGGGPNDGLQNFSQDKAASFDHTFFKTYFNGVAGCDDSITDIIKVVPGPKYSQSPVYDWNFWSDPCQVFNLQVTFPSDPLNFRCYAPNVPGGLNNRMMAAGINEEKSSESNSESRMIRLYPNPSNSFVFIEAQKGSKLQDAVITIKNTLGENIAEIHPDQAADSNAPVRVDFNTLNIPEGVYFLNITEQGKSTNYQIVYKKD